ncbi:hypothetical protein D9M71_417050 [compost metagenome]
MRQLAFNMILQPPMFAQQRARGVANAMAHHPPFVANLGKHQIDRVLADDGPFLTTTRKQVAAAPSALVQLDQHRDQLMGQGADIVPAHLHAFSWYGPRPFFKIDFIPRRIPNHAGSARRQYCHPRSNPRRQPAGGLTQRLKKFRQLAFTQMRIVLRGRRHQRDGMKF